MESISSADQRKISVFVRELYSLRSVNSILDRVVQNLHKLIAANSIFVPAFDPRTGIMSVLADDVGPELHKLWPRLVALRHENPALTYHLSHSTAPAFTDEGPASASGLQACTGALDERQRKGTQALDSHSWRQRPLSCPTLGLSNRHAKSQAPRPAGDACHSLLVWNQTQFLQLTLAR
jgi:hypothetical protein